MVWTLTKAERLDRVFSVEEKKRFDKSAQARLSRLQCSARFTYLEIDANGVTVPGQQPHVYFEPVVSECSDEGLARLGRDHLAQLNKVTGLERGAVDVASLVAPSAPPDKTQEQIDADAAVAAKRDEIVGALQRRISHLKAIELGILSADDPSVSETKAQLDAAMQTDAGLVLSLIG